VNRSTITQTRSFCQYKLTCFFFGAGQLLLWISFAEVFGSLALFETLDGGKRAPGDFK
jgi:hypothetical protein